MKACELRIGNLFIGIAGVQTVKSIIDFSDRGDWNGLLPQKGYEHLITVKENGNQYKPCEIEFILLTKDWLLKAGFHKGEVRQGYDYWFPDHDALWSMRQEGNGKWQFCILVRENEIWKFDPIIEHVHQLQNLVFAISGQELTIK